MNAAAKLCKLAVLQIVSIFHVTETNVTFINQACVHLCDEIGAENSVGNTLQLCTHNQSKTKLLENKVNIYVNVVRSYPTQTLQLSIYILN